MEVSSSHQMYVFALYLLMGMLCGAFFDVQRFLRRLHRAGRARTQLEDVLFAFVCVGAMLGLSYFFNNGEIRYYQIMGSVSGVLFYSAALSRAFMKILNVITVLIKNIIIKPVIKICCVLLIPILKVFRHFRKICTKVKKLFLRVGRKIKIRKKSIKKRIKML